ncbi:MAG: YiaA/YiaB family inner membrane protein [Myxococcota bacterium]
MARIGTPQPHSQAWTLQVWISWLVAVFAMLGGILFVPATIWVKGYLFIGLWFVIGSTMNLAKTIRDNHEASKIHSVIHDARLEKILAEHDPLK